MLYNNQRMFINIRMNIAYNFDYIDNYFFSFSMQFTDDSPATFRFILYNIR